MQRAEGCTGRRKFSQSFKTQCTIVVSLSTRFPLPRKRKRESDSSCVSPVHNRTRFLLDYAVCKLIIPGFFWGGHFKVHIHPIQEFYALGTA